MVDVARELFEARGLGLQHLAAGAEMGDSLATMTRMACGRVRG
jgi:hypothetical protein